MNDRLSVAECLNVSDGAGLARMSCHSSTMHDMDVPGLCGATQNGVMRLTSLVNDTVYLCGSVALVKVSIDGSTRKNTSWLGILQLGSCRVHNILPFLRWQLPYFSIKATLWTEKTVIM